MKRAGEDNESQSLVMGGCGSSIHSCHFSENLRPHKAKIMTALMLGIVVSVSSSQFILVGGLDLSKNSVAMFEQELHSLAKNHFLFLLESRLQVPLVSDAQGGMSKPILCGTRTWHSAAAGSYNKEVALS